MKQFLSKIASITLAFLVLFSTFSFTVDKHYCGDFLIDVSFMGDAGGCLGAISSENTIQTKKCCKDEVQQFKGQDELRLTSIDKISFEKQQFLTAFIISYQNIFSKTQVENINLNDFSPPETHQNYQVIYQSFLI
ncbi:MULTISPECIES: HYC_CC_PP family protein [unclassified Polaribacter]|uniref:HYC_CC_PP family protein n=1 Tax=unclassified Polaribacter TaxID=196858 RepID=UPI0011BED167|nr:MULTISPECIES: hypothetical protein [unclassified Polaribacter]TXD53243.1 hypothetical protein ES043_05235 [Polaribacter sp. IC063]TXD61389.1 hypothetical protein ES044_05205 [Polaribacter sp. IC066]